MTIDDVMAGLQEHVDRMRDARARVPEPVDWYLYDILANLHHVNALLEGDERDLDRLAGGRPVADIGAADGDLAFTLEAACGWDVDIVDNASTNMNRLRAAAALKEALGSRAQIHDLDLDTQFRLPRDRYGLVFLLGILYHLQNPFYALRELARHADHCILSTRVARFAGPERTPIGDLSVGYLVGPDELNHDATNYWIFSPRGFEQLAERAGWEIVRSFTAGDTEGSTPDSSEHDERLFALLRSRPQPAAPRPAAAAPPATGWLTMPASGEGDIVAKPAPYLPIYERLLAARREEPLALLELGVWNGASLEMWRDALPAATIVGVDLAPPELHLGPRVRVAAGDQSDAELLDRLRAEHAPGGFDVIVDDASHNGVLTARSLQALYARHLRPGGIYVIEDWTSGYMGSWPDGAELDRRLETAELDAAVETPDGGTRMPSHDRGMVGLAKRLVDHAAAGAIGVVSPERLGSALGVERLTVESGLVVLHKPAA